MRPKTNGKTGACKREVIILDASVTAHVVNPRIVEHVFVLQCSSRQQTSLILAKTDVDVVVCSVGFLVS